MNLHIAILCLRIASLVSKLTEELALLFAVCIFLIVRYISLDAKLVSR